MALGEELYRPTIDVRGTGGHQCSSESAIIEAEGVGYSYGETAVLHGVSLALPVGETLAVVGPSGCGKTTFLSMIAGLISPTEGSLKVGGQTVAPRRPGTALIMQDYGLLPWKTVFQNAALGLQIRRLPTEAAKQALDEVGIAHLASRWPNQLSGGQRQRVAIARALALSPDLLLMDEPFSALDALTREEMQDLLLKIWQRHQTSMVLVTHSIPEAVYIGRQILVLSPGPGRVIGYFRNSAVGDRKSKEFYEMVNAVRTALEKGAAMDA